MRAAVYGMRPRTCVSVCACVHVYVVFVHTCTSGLGMKANAYVGRFFRLSKVRLRRITHT